MKFPTGTAILLLAAGFEQGVSQNMRVSLEAAAGAKGSIHAALIRKYTAGLHSDSQMPVSMDGFYAITAHQLDSLADVMKADVDAQYQKSYKALLMEITTHENELGGEDAELEYTQGMTAVKWLKNKAAELRYRQRTEHKFCFLPVRNAIDASMYHSTGMKKQNPIGLRNLRLGLQSETRQYAMYTDLYTDYFGAVTAGVGTLLGLGSTDDETTDSMLQANFEAPAMNRLLFGGGNVVIHLTYPLLYWNRPEEHLDFRLNFHPRLGIDVPDLGGQSTSYAMNLDLGIVSSIIYRGLNDNIALLADYKAGIIWGNDLFYENLGGGVQGKFDLHRFSVGLRLGHSIEISWMTYYSMTVNSTTPSSILSVSMAVN